MFWPFSEYVRFLVRLRSWYVPSLFHLCSVYDLSTFPLFSSTSDQSQSLWKYHIFPNVVNNESKAASFSVGQRMPKVGHFQLLVSVTLIASVIVWLFQRSACSDFFRDFCVPTMRCNEASGCCESQPSADKLLPKRSSASIVKINSDQGAPLRILSFRRICTFRPGRPLQHSFPTLSNMYDQIYWWWLDRRSLWLEEGLMNAISNWWWMMQLRWLRFTRTVTDWRASRSSKHCRQFSNTQPLITTHNSNYILFKTMFFIYGMYPY